MFVSSFLVRIFTCDFYIKNRSFLQHLGNTTLYFQFAEMKISLSLFSFTGPEVPGGSCLAFPGTESVTQMAGISTLGRAHLCVIQRCPAAWLVNCSQP